MRPGRRAAIEFGESLAAHIERSGGSVAADPSDKPDMVVAVGGDGTMLAAVRRAVGWDVPVLGFNLGTLGFLAGAEPSDMAAVADRLMAGEYEIEERTTVSASVGDATGVGVNDVVVEKIDSTRLVALDVAIDGEPFASYRADGLLVATPTGSTAYSFSAGGPLVDPRVDALVMTPIASHSLFDRPLALPSTSTIRVTVIRDRLVKVNVDKYELGELGEGESAEIGRGDRPARFVTLAPHPFPGVVRDKFGL